MIKKMLIIGTLICITPFLAQANLYYRFWQGYKGDSLTYNQFLTGLAQEFMPRTVQAAEDKGLEAYLPALPDSHTCLDNGTCLPDEVALVVYQSEAAYKKLQNDPAWKKYAHLHWKYFDSKKSHSLVPKPYKGKLENNHAYDVVPSAYDHNPDWQSGYAVYQISKKLKQPDAYVDFMHGQSAEKGLIAYEILIEKSYVIEYQLWQNKRSFQYMEPVIKNITQSYLYPIAGAGGYLRKTHINDPVHINYGEGLNFQF